MKGLEINKLAMGIRMAIIDDLINDLQHLKLEVKRVNTEKLRERLESIFE